MGKDLKMRRLVNGSGDIAEMGTTITCNMKGYLVFDEKVQQHHFEEWKNQKFKIGESDAIPGVEMALRFSRVGDLIRVRCQSRFCYGPAGRPPVVVGGSTTDQPDNGEAGRTISAIPPDTDLEYELEIAAHLREGSIDPDLMDVAKKTFERLGATNHDAEMPVKLQERLLALTELQQRKEAGNRWFSYGDFTRAARAYSKATQIADRYFNGNANTGNSNARALEGLNIKDGVESSVAAAEAALAQAEKEKEQQRRIFEAGDEEVVSVYVSCLNNMAACQLKLGENAKAKDICVRVLEMDPTNHKALLRAAKAALATHVSEKCSYSDTVAAFPFSMFCFVFLALWFFVVYIELRGVRYVPAAPASSSHTWE